VVVVSGVPEIVNVTPDGPSYVPLLVAGPSCKVDEVLGEEQPLKEVMIKGVANCGLPISAPAIVQGDGWEITVISASGIVVVAVRYCVLEPLLRARIEPSRRAG
jgi:hypothetical protein